MGGLEATQFSLRETGSDSGVFTGTFAIPAEYCADGLRSNHRHRR